MKRLFLALSLILAPLVHAGSAEAVITGVTSSGRTKLTVKVDDVTGSINRVNLSIDDKSYQFTPEDYTVIKDKDNGIYILIAKHKNYLFKMWMIPRSEKVIFSNSHSLKTSFGAVIEATDPRQNKRWKVTPRITIGCKLEYSI